MFHRVMYALILAGFSHKIQVAAEGCFSGGEAGDCSAAVSSFCSTIGGELRAGEQRSKCYQESDFKCDLTIENVGAAGSPEVFDCETALNLEVTGCSTGGIKTLEGFQYTLDPNAGFC